LIPLAFQLQRCNFGEDSCRAQHIQAAPEQFDAVEDFAARCGLATADPEPPADEAGTNCKPSSLVIWEIGYSVAAFTFRIL
jgi:hypothetical protein